MAEYRILQEATGRKTHANPITLPSGTAKVLNNLECVREGVYRKPRGRDLYGSGLPSSNINQFLDFVDRLHVHTADGQLSYDSNGSGTFLQYSGTYSAPESGFLIRGIEANSNFYFTTSLGIKKIQSLGGTINEAGAPRGLGMDLRIVDDINWMTTGNTVAYRAVWSYEDANTNKIIGAPSERVEVSNSSGGDRAVEARIQIPADATTSYKMSLYRSSQSTGVPPEDFQLVYENNPTSAEISSGLMTITDITPDDFRGADLYTNTTIEGIEQSNYRPPKACCFDTYKDFVFYGNVEGLHRLFTNLISVSNFTPGTTYVRIFDSGNDEIGTSISGAADNGAGLIRITTSTAHSLSTGDYVYIYDVAGTTEANHSWKVTVIDTTNFDLDNSTFANPYTSGGYVTNALNLGQIRYDTNVGGTGIGSADGITNCADNGAGLIRVTTGLAHNLSTGDYVRIDSVVGTTEANSSWIVTVIDTTNFDLQGSVFANPYVSGGNIDIVTNLGTGVASMADNGSGQVRATTTALHGLSVGDYIFVYDSTGTDIDGVHEIIAVPASTTFDIDVTYVGTGTATIDRYESLGNTDNRPKFFKHTTGTDAQNVDMTARSFVKTINLALANTFCDAYYTSGIDDAVGKIEIDAQTVGQEYLYMQASSTAVGSNYTPVVPITGDKTYRSINDDFANGLMYSKANEPEAVPLVNILYVGSRRDPIVGVIGLRDSLYIIKQKDGVYRLTGDSSASFVLTRFDDTLRNTQIHSIAKGENSFVMFTETGYARISDTGVELLRDNLYKDMIPSKNANFSTGYGWFYETENTYYCSTHLNTSSTDNDIVNSYNTQTQAWRQGLHGTYTNDANIRCGIIVNDVMYTGALSGSTIYKERKSYTASDIRNADISITITDIDTDTNTVTISSGVSVPIESLLVQGSATKTITEITDSTHLVLSNVNNLIAAAATIQQGIVSTITYQQVHCGLPEYEKQFDELSILFDNDETNTKNLIVRTSTDLDKTTQDTLFNPVPGEYWGKKWGVVWGTKKVTDKMLTLTPKEHTKGSYLTLTIEHRNPNEQIALCGASLQYDVTSEEYRA